MLSFIIVNDKLHILLKSVNMYEYVNKTWSVKNNIFTVFLLFPFYCETMFDVLRLFLMTVRQHVSAHLFIYTT